MKSNWQIWEDYKLKWDPREYGGIKDLHFPGEHSPIWTPDILLYNRFMQLNFLSQNNIFFKKKKNSNLILGFWKNVKHWMIQETFFFFLNF